MRLVSANCVPIFIEANRRLRQALKARGYNVRYVEVIGGRHDPINWRFQLADGLMHLAGKRPQKPKQ
jgi:enterochelin esterase family protein